MSRLLNPNPTPEGFDINTLASSMVDRRREGLYDRVRLHAGAPTPRIIKCFQKGVGEKPYSDTNMRGDGELDVPFDVIVRRFLMVFQPGGARADEHSFLRNYTWELWILQKCFQRHPLLEFSVKGNIADVIRQFGSNDCKGTLERFAVPYAFNLYDYTRYIPPQVTFNVSLVGEPFVPEQNMDFYSILDGTMDFPVQ
jgi:hypothetical protein